MYVSSLLLLSEKIYGTRPCYWGTPWDLNSLLFSVWMFFCWLRVYISHPLFFLECVYLSLLYPSLIFDMFLLLLLLLCVCVCVCIGVVLGFTNSYFSSMCVLGIFLCMCGSVVLNLQVTFFLIVFVCVYVYTYLCMFVCVHIFIYIYVCVCVCVCVCF